ncbi:MAG: conjugal transfer protein TraN, partial [Caldimicrobium sp.]|nr:conjugal transfer protein TraN [Caldimicrobium sp.]
GDRAAMTAAASYAETLGPTVAMAILHLGISGLVKDPQVAAVLNLAADAAYYYLVVGFQNLSWLGWVGFAAAVIGTIASFLFGGGCDKEDVITVTMRESGRCHYVGKRCIKKLRLGPIKKCIQKAKYYCCFNSKLARIIHEQGRPQLNTDIRSWGSAKRPNCRGFTPEEFASLDFDKIDLSEYFEDITRNVAQGIETNMQQFFYDSIQTRISSR